MRDKERRRERERERETRLEKGFSKIFANGSNILPAFKQQLITRIIFFARFLGVELLCNSVCIIQNITKSLRNFNLQYNFVSFFCLLHFVFVNPKSLAYKKKDVFDSCGCFFFKGKNILRHCILEVHSSSLLFSETSLIDSLQMGKQPFI